MMFSDTSGSMNSQLKSETRLGLQFYYADEAETIKGVIIVG